MKLGESPILEGFPCCNDITFSKIRHNLAKKSPKMRCARDFPGGRRCHGCQSIASLKAFQTQILKKLDNQSG